MSRQLEPGGTNVDQSSRPLNCVSLRICLGESNNGKSIRQLVPMLRHVIWQGVGSESDDGVRNAGQGRVRVPHDWPEESI